jgi:DNA-binding XRE family transcriptional regulator
MNPSVFPPMTSPLLPNHLRPHRKSLALSQDEVAFLLGNQNGAQVCRYEQFDRVPSLETALAFEAMFKKSVSELFPGLYQTLAIVQGDAFGLWCVHVILLFLVVRNN